VGIAIYSDEFKDGAVKQVLEGGHPVQEVAKRLGVSSKSIYTWLCEHGSSRARRAASSARVPRTSENKQGVFPLARK
jgi:transposase